MRDCTDHEGRRDDLRDREVVAAAAWAVAWSATQLEVIQPDDALAWLDAREKVIALARVWSRQRRTRHAGWDRLFSRAERANRPEREDDERQNRKRADELRPHGLPLLR